MIFMKQQPAKCLVTGATGFLGTVIVKTLNEAGFDVISLAKPGDDVSHVSQYSCVRCADVCDASALEREIIGADIVVHLAGIVDITVRNRSLIRQVNVEGTRNVAKICRKYEIKMIYCSSVHVLPCLPNNELITETAVIDPRKVSGTYGKTKAEATGIVLELAKNGLDAIVFFPSGVIGPYERRVSNIGQMIVDFLCGGLTAYLDGKYNFVDVRDVAKGVCGIIENWKSGESYIFSGHEISVERMLSEVAKASGEKMLRTKLPYWFVLGTSYLSEFYYFLLRKKPLFTHYSIQTLRSNCNFSSQKSNDALGFIARPCDESLADMTHWIMEHFVVKKGRKYKPCLFHE
jgi:dihydroflavonol-4-reductase